MHKQFAYRALLACGLLHNLSFQLWKEANHIVSSRMNCQPTQVPGTPEKAMLATACKPCGTHGVVFDHIKTLCCLQDKKRLVGSCWNNRLTHSGSLLQGKNMYISAARWVNIILDAASGYKSFYLPLWLTSAEMFPNFHSIKLWSLEAVCFLQQTAQPTFSAAHAQSQQTPVLTFLWTSTSRSHFRSFSFC